MWLTNKEEQSEFFYNECFRIHAKGKTDTEELWKNIEDEKYICLYCKTIEDRAVLWSKIRSSFWAYEYCKEVCNRPEVRILIVEIRHIYKYCLDIDPMDLTMVRKIPPCKYLFYYYKINPNKEILHILRYYYAYIRSQLSSGERHNFDRTIGMYTHPSRAEFECFLTERLVKGNKK